MNNKAFTFLIRHGVEAIPCTRVTISSLETGINADFNAAFDTGSTISSISENVIKRLHLKNYGSMLVSSAADTAYHHLYRANFILLDKIEFLNTMTLDFRATPSIDVLIGMDIIRQGDLSLTQDTSGNTLVSFRVPSTQDAIDFTKGRAPAALTSAP